MTCRLADHVIATNQSYKAMVMQRGGVPEGRITIVRNGPELKHLSVVQPDPELRKEGRTLIGYVGNMGHQDGVDHLLRALRHLLFDLGRSDFDCVLIGTGSAWNGLKQLAIELGLENHVRFTGWVSDADLLRYLSSADICVDPDPSNPFNDRCTMIKMTEYMALSKPIVAFDLPEHRVTAQGAAVYASNNDEMEFARLLTQLMDDPIRRHQMGTLGRERVEKTLAWQHQAAHLLAAYEMITQGRSTRENSKRVSEMSANELTGKTPTR
jgi:glycosyltransferase involved in cell wall biosynthesis